MVRFNSEISNSLGQKKSHEYTTECTEWGRGSFTPLKGSSQGKFDRIIARKEDIECCESSNATFLGNCMQEIYEPAAYQHFSKLSE